MDGVIRMVYHCLQLEEKDARRRVKMQAVQAEVQAIQRENVRLETFRQQAVSARARLQEQEAINERLRKSLDVQTQEMAAAEAKAQQLRSQYDGFEKQQHRQEAKVWLVQQSSISVSNSNRTIQNRSTT